MSKIQVGDKVYQKKRGWSGLPMLVLEINKVNTPNGEIEQALCRGTDGWSVTGLYNNKHKCYVERYAVKNLTHEYNSAVKP